MQLNVDVGQPAQPAAGSAESPQPWILDLNRAGDSPSAALPGLAYSFQAECECPADCLRDHENE